MNAKIIAYDDEKQGQQIVLILQCRHPVWTLPWCTVGTRGTNSNLLGRDTRGTMSM